MSALGDEEKAAVAAQIAGIRAGPDPALYAAVFGEIRAKRARLRTALEEGSSREDAADAPEDVAAAVAARMPEYFAAEGVTAAEKHGLLACVVKQIVPTEDGCRMDLLPEAAAAPGSIVQSISIIYTVHDFRIEVKDSLKAA